MQQTQYWCFSPKSKDKDEWKCGKIVFCTRSGSISQHAQAGSDAPAVLLPHLNQSAG